LILARRLHLGAVGQLLARLLQQIHVLVRELREVALPEHRHEIILVRRRLAGALDDLEQLHDFGLFKPGCQPELADAVLVEEPREIVGRLVPELAGDDGVEPADLGLANREHQFIRLGPHRPKPPAKRVDRAAVDRIVGEIQLLRARGLDDESEQFLHGRRWERRIQWLRTARRPGRKRRRWEGCHASKIRISLTCATSLSPRPLTHRRIGSSFCQRPRWEAIQLTACAVSRAGMIPSRRLSSWNPFSASRSVTATYWARPVSLRYECSGPTPG